ncbi:MAG: exopolysaccharide biosynthesis polyprenyl glycosylphosphotransferase [bacterium]|nr:exopolysaccharide biosynthesis polyprenyl glycosylphosphotransferase [bacterium]
MDNKNYQYKRIFMFWAGVLFVAIQTALFAWQWYHIYRGMMLVQYYRRGDWAVIGLYGLFCVLFLKLFGGLKVGYLRNMDVLFGQTLAICFQNAVVYLQLALLGKWKFGTHLEHFPFLMLTEFGLAIIWTIMTRHFYAKLYPPHQMLLIYGDISPRLLMQKLDSRQDRYQIRETIKLDAGMDVILEKIKEYDTIIIGDIPSRERNEFLKFCYWHEIRCYSIPKISDIIITGADRIDLFDSILMLSRNNGLSIGQRFFKRLMDIVISLVGIILSSPIMLIIVIAIKLYDHGPVFYTQERITKDGKSFQILKFRSMIVESEAAGAQLAQADDDRITPVGRIIRRTHFDELPQLFNILHGEMSVVGPRPERQEIFDQYEESIPEFKFRLKMKAGLTGYAQVYGQYNTVPYDKLKLDLTYIENYSFWLDLKLCLLTAKILFQKEKSEGVDNSQTTALVDKKE